MDEDFIGCFIPQLPEDKQVEAARVAIDYCPSNAPTAEVAAAISSCALPMLAGFIPQPPEGVAAEPFVPPDAVITPYHLAVLTSRYWGSAGVKLTVGFPFDSTPNDLKNRILAHMNAWGKYCNVQFVLTATDPQVRISRAGDGYWSYLGTDILSIPKNQPTMNLQGFTMATPESEFVRVVRHETGHTCLAGDTMIDCPRDLEKYPKGVPIRELVGQQPMVYAWKDGQPVIRKASRVWMSKKSAKVVRVRTKAGPGPKNRTFLPPLELVGTPDHRVLLADGVTWKAMGELKSGDRICSLYRNKNGRRSTIRWTGSNGRVREHVFVAEQVYGQRPDNCHAHHKNENMMDQTPDNLEWKDKHLHASDHGKGRKPSEEAVAMLIRRNKSRVWTKEMRAKVSESHKRIERTEEELAALAVRAREQFKGKKQSPELVAKRMAGMARYYANGGRSGMFGKQASEETRAKRSASMKATLAAKRAANNHVVVSVEVLEERIDVYDMTVPDADSFIANGCVVHNCGFPHEHMRGELVARLDVQKTLAYFARYQGWNAQTTRQQVLTPLSEASIRGTPNADQDSIMCYRLPGSITTDGQPIRGGNDIDDLDAQWASKLYPKAVEPVEPKGAEKHRVTLIVGGGFASVEDVQVLTES